MMDGKSKPGQSKKRGYQNNLESGHKQVLDVVDRQTRENLEPATRQHFEKSKPKMKSAKNVKD